MSTRVLPILQVARDPHPLRTLGLPSARSLCNEVLVESTPPHFADAEPFHLANFNQAGSTTTTYTLESDAYQVYTHPATVLGYQDVRAVSAPPTTSYYKIKRHSNPV